MSYKWSNSHWLITSSLQSVFLQNSFFFSFLCLADFLVPTLSEVRINPWILLDSPLSTPVLIPQCPTADAPRSPHRRNTHQNGIHPWGRATEVLVRNACPFLGGQTALHCQTLCTPSSELIQCLWIVSQYIKRETLINNSLTPFIKCILLLICIKQNQMKNQFLSVN